MLKYASVCSGIEAATVAWKHMNWKAVWFSEIETFPCKVLVHHYPNTPNLGDMTKLKGNDIYEQSTFDVLVGGTPCQSFSIAGLRGGMADERGNLALEFCRILIDKSPRWFLWENVPGVFSSFSNAEDSEDTTGDGNGRGDGDCITETSDFATLLTAFRECGYSCAWRVLDSRYFGVPQRRRRIFVVGYLGGDWRPPTAVLFERESLSRDFTPSRAKRKKSTTSAETNTGRGNQVWPADVASTLNTKFGDKMGLDNQHINEGAPLFVPVPAYGIQANIVNRTEKSGGNGLGVKEEEAPTLTKNDQHCVMQPIVYDTTQITHPKNGSNPQAGDPCRTLAKGGDAPLLVQPIILDDQGGNVMTVYDQGHTGTLRAQTHGHEPIVVQPTKCYVDDRRRGLEINDNISPTVLKFWGTGGGNAPFVQSSMVRRLTPLECERLQGFPDGYTAIPGASDSKRYAALGNSMTVNVMKWIGERIDKVDKLITKLNSK